MTAVPTSSEPLPAVQRDATGGGRRKAPRRTGTTWLRVALAGTAAVAVAGIVSLVAPDPPDAVPLAAATAPAGGGESRRIELIDAGAQETAAPVRVQMPSIGVDSPLVELGVDGDGVLVPPADFAQAGWYEGGPAPGDVGPAVIAGHVDSRSGPAVFFRLDELVVGDEVLVERTDGTTVRFTVSGSERYPKDAFPTEDVYGPTPRAELRLITCGGEFDRDRRSYRDNVVVTAVLP